MIRLFDVPIKICFRVSQNMYIDLKSKSHSLGLSVSDYLRRLINTNLYRGSEHANNKTDINYKL